MLAQETVNGEEHPIAYYSRKMQPRECIYSATKQEGLAVMNACMHFTPYLLGHPFTVVTDHKALLLLALTLRQFTFSIKYRPGKDNTNADALSCQAWSTHAEKQQMDKNLFKEG